MLECKKHKNIKLIGNFDLCIKCGHCTGGLKISIPLRPIHNWLLYDLREGYPQHYLQTRTNFFYTEMWRYIFEKKVFRIAIMGETRGGKSEVAQTLSLNFTIIYNALFEEGHFKNMLIDEKVIFKKITLNTDFIHANESNYLYFIRDMKKENNLIFGQIHIIDESRDNPGGIGSFSEEVEILNLNNIIAKFCQNEIWITPRRFITMNTPYGANCYIKDEKNKLNWLLLYKLEMQSAGLREQNFLGWISIGLHDNKELRVSYNEKKDSWIEKEMQGTINERAFRRQKAVEYFLEDKEFIRHHYNKGGQVIFDHSIEEMKYLVEKASMEHKIDQFNDTEIERIVAGVKASAEIKLRERGY